MSEPIYDATDHDNLELTTTYGVERAGSVKKAIENDGTLIMHVTCVFVVHHAAYEPVTNETLKGLIESQGVTEENVIEAYVMEANND